MASIGFIGTGMMGAAMVHRLLTHGHTVGVWNRTPERTEPLKRAGATVYAALERLIVSHTTIVSMVSTSEVLSQIAGSVRHHGGPGTVHVDMSTVSPDVTRQCDEEARKAGQAFVHAPVLGSVPQVEEGTLLIFAGGSEGALEAATPVFEVLGAKVFHFAQPADATRMKLACNFFIASMIMTLGQGLQFVQVAGLSGDTLLDILGRSALAAPMYATKGRNILSDNFSPRFLLDHMLKDVRLFRDAAAELGLSPVFGPPLESAFEKASGEGWGSSDYSSVVKIL